MARKIYWLSESIGPIQQQIVRDIHGEDVEVVQDLTQFSSTEEFATYLRGRKDDFVYVLRNAGPLDVLLPAAKETGLTFGTMAGREVAGTFVASQVFWVNWPREGTVSEVWPGSPTTIRQRN